MSSYRVVSVEDVKKFLKKVGIEADIPEGGRVSFLVKKKNDDEVVAIVKGKKKYEIPIPMSNYENYLKYGRFDAKPKRGGKRGPRGSKTLMVLQKIQDFLNEKDEVTLPDVWSRLSSDGTVKYRAQLYQIVVKFCETEKVQVGNRNVLIIKGVKSF